ncbi:methyltransferase [Spirosoma sp. HMF4905]|uniref:Methyltransferase n=1 Tax=Spirosoma arboris TaxID=2682092 RepID=A0A7K1SAS8_9BACT|nr:HemK2/MTQ2 family protein methyltransferase [Spirosoma arboris]MVM30917.1 methyltransferase [Spirosoma arboris]
MSLSKSIRKTFGRWVLIPATKYYLSKERKIALAGLEIKVPPGVFHPTLFSSTKLLLEFVNSQPVLGLKVLELGAGSGLLAVDMARNGALVTASDINPIACATVRENARINDVVVNVVHSDLFDQFVDQLFDLILINPPYYPKTPKTDAEKAWFCGDDYEYFKKLFSQLAHFLSKTGYAMMILSEDCNLKKIHQLATEKGYKWQSFSTIKKNGEWYYLVKLSV